MSENSVIDCLVTIKNYFTTNGGEKSRDPCYKVLDKVAVGILMLWESFWGEENYSIAPRRPKFLPPSDVSTSVATTGAVKAARNFA